MVTKMFIVKFNIQETPYKGINLKLNILLYCTKWFDAALLCTF